MNFIRKNWCCQLLLAGAVVAAAFVPASTRADVIIDWNIKSDEIAAQKQVLPFNHSRGTAMLHVAMFEAVNAVEGRYLPYKLNLTADRTASKEAAAASAGHDILLALYPDQQSTLDATLATMLSRHCRWSTESKRRRPREKGCCRFNRAPRQRWNGRPRNVSATYRPGRVCTNRCSSILHIRSRHSVGDGERLSISPRRAAGAHLGDLDKGR